MAVKRSSAMPAAAVATPRFEPPVAMHFHRLKNILLGHRRRERAHVAQAPDPRRRVAGVLGFQKMFLHAHVELSDGLHGIDGGHADEREAHAVFFHQPQHRARRRRRFQLHARIAHDQVLARPARLRREQRHRQPHLLPRPPFAHRDLDELLPDARVLAPRMPVLDDARFERGGIARRGHVVLPCDDFRMQRAPQINKKRKKAEGVS